MMLISDSIQTIVSCIMYYTVMFYKNVREYRRGNQKWRETGNIGYIIRKKTQSTTKYVLDTTMRKQTQIT